MKSQDFLNNKKIILDNYNKKKFEKVIKLGKKFLKTNNDFQILYVLGLTYLTLKNYFEAEKFFKNIILLKPDAENYYIYGNIQKQLKNYNEASDNFIKAINLKSDYSEAYNNLGNIRFKLGFINEAVENYKKAIKFDKKNIQAYFNLAHIYSEEKNFDALKKILKNVLKFDEKNTTALNDLGYLNLILGNVDEGRKLFERVIDIDSNYIRAFKNYFLITKAKKDNKFLKTLEKIDLSNVNDEDKILVYTSLSKCNFDINNSDLGLKYLEEAHKIKKINSSFSLQAEKKLFEKIKYVFEKNLVEFIRHDNKLNFTPIFVVGMPRSGTTFLEQVLSSHSNIHGAGELNYLPKIIDNVKSDKLQNFDSFIKNIRSEYHEKLLQLSDKKFIIDKLPMNFRWIGFIVKAFPEARIIHIQRNPMAICWSNYKINFPDPGMDFSLTQKDTAEYYILYDDLMKFWFDKLKEKIININYENFVNDFENETLRLIKKLGIKWEENLKNYSKNVRPVQTASLMQVRGKLKKNTSEEWKKYRDHLKIMQETLDSAKIKY